MALSPAEMARQALVLYVDSGHVDARGRPMMPGEVMDELENEYREMLQQEIDDAAGVPDNMILPEGMHLMEGSLGVIPPHA